MPSNKPSSAPSSSEGGGQRRRARDGDAADAVPTDTLWVGNLSSDAVDSDVMSVFADHGALDCTTMYGNRFFAFVYFRTVDEATAAKDALQGTKLHGNQIKIEFARPAKSCKNLWIGGISSSLTKEELEDEFLKFGKIEDFKFFRDRNSAHVDYYKVEDAISAQKSMNGKLLAGEKVHVGFLRPQPSRRDWPDRHDSRDGHFSHRRNIGASESAMPVGLRNFHDSSQYGPKRHLSSGPRRDGQPTNVLWIGYPSSSQIDEESLHNSMILFGEINRIKCFPSRHYAFVEFRSIDEARRAKEGLQGRLFGDPRIQILFSSSDLTPNKDPPYFPGDRGSRPEMFYNDVGPLEFIGPGYPMAPNNFPGPLASSGTPGTGILMRPFSSQGFDPRHGGLEFPEFGNALNNWKRQSPAPGLLPSPSGATPHFAAAQGGWDGLDMREQKRQRLGGSPPISETFHGRLLDPEAIRDPLKFAHLNRGASGRIHHSPFVRGRDDRHGYSDFDNCWRGIIAKGGSHVCHARCVPIGKGIDSPFPEVVNCSARTGLDMLAKHYAEAIGFDIVFFLPDSEEDFASYTEFLRYLGLKDRAGVAKLDDGTTLFLVPPSEFLTNVLNVTGPDRLYGVVLRLPHQPTSASMQQPQLAIPRAPTHDVDWPQAPSSQDDFVRQNERQTLDMDYTQSVQHEGSMYQAGVGKILSSHADELQPRQSIPLDGNLAARSQVEVSLTPELIATLASLIPGNSQPVATGAVQMHLNSLVKPSSTATSVMHSGQVPMQGWMQGQHAKTFNSVLEQSSYVPQQVGQQFSNQAQLISQFPTHSNNLNQSDNSAQPILNGTQIQDSSLHMPQSSAVPTMALNNYVPSQSGQFLTQRSNQQYQLDSSLTPHNNDYATLLTTNAAGVSNPQVHQQLMPTNSSAHGQAGNLPQAPQIELPSLGQQLQTVLSGSGQGTSEGDTDKNQRYQSTLQFAASLLLQIQQQQASGQAVQGSGNQQ